MYLYIFFGLPGTGKTYCSQIAKKFFGYHLYDGDKDLTSEMHKAIQEQAVITDEMRDVFFENLIFSVKDLMKRYSKLIVHQTFIKEKYREQFLNAIPSAKFILIETDTLVREKRLRGRTVYPLDQEYARRMAKLFDKPKIKHAVLVNNEEGEKSVKEQLHKLLV